MAPLAVGAEEAPPREFGSLLAAALRVPGLFGGGSGASSCCSQRTPSEPGASRRRAWEAATGSRQRPTVRRALSAREPGEDGERCGCCTKEVFWAFYDVFAKMDRRGVGAASRSDFVWALSALGTDLVFQKAARRATLSAHFHDSAEDLPLAEFMLRVLPPATSADLERMSHWAELRQAHRILTKPSFGGNRDELWRAYLLLKGAECSGLPIEEMQRAHLLTAEELRASVPSEAASQPLPFELFAELLGPLLHAKFARTPSEASAESRTEESAAVRKVGPVPRTSAAWASTSSRPCLLPRLPLRRAAGAAPAPPAKPGPRHRARRLSTDGVAHLCGFGEGEAVEVSTSGHLLLATAF